MTKPNLLVPQPGMGKLMKAGLLVAVPAALANLALWAVAKFAAGGSFVFAMKPGAAPAELPVIMVALETALPLLLAPLLLALLGKFLKQPVRVFQIITGALALLSIAAPLALEADAATKYGLAAMHIVAAWAVVSIPRFAK